LPFEIEGTGSQRRYRMEQEVAEAIRSAPPPPTWTVERFRTTMLDEVGPDAVTVLEDCLAWAERHGGEYVFGGGPTGPIRFVVPDHAGQPVKALLLNSAEGVGVQYTYLKDHPPFDEEDERRDLTLRLNELHGISIPDGRWNRKAFYVKLELLSSPADRAAFFGIFDDVARRLSGFSS
jgi:hypothetical protein